MDQEQKEQLNFGVVNTPSGIIIPDIIDKKMAGTKYIRWGDDNKLPYYLWDNYLKCSLFASIVNRIKDYIIGESIQADWTKINTDGDTIEDVIEKCVLDYIIFGGFAVECIRNLAGDLVVLRYINVMNVRVDEELTTAYLSNQWNIWNGKNIIELPLFNVNEKQPHFIMYYRGAITRNINPVPIYIAAMKSIAILNNTRNFHLRNLENGFSANAIINLNNSNIKSRELQEIKDKLERGYCGSENAGKFILMNGGDKDHASTIERLDVDHFGELYMTLDESSKEDIYTAFAINPILLGVNVQTGFSKEEFENAYALFYGTVILPLQKNIIKAFKKLGVNVSFDSLQINWAE